MSVAQRQAAPRHYAPTRTPPPPAELPVTPSFTPFTDAGNPIPAYARTACSPRIIGIRRGKMSGMKCARKDFSTPAAAGSYGDVAAIILHHF